MLCGSGRGKEWRGGMMREGTGIGGGQDWWSSALLDPYPPCRPSGAILKVAKELSSPIAGQLPLLG